jgi:hypothetical protein
MTAKSFQFELDYLCKLFEKIVSPTRRTRILTFLLIGFHRVDPYYTYCTNYKQANSAFPHHALG